MRPLVLLLTIVAILPLVAGCESSGGGSSGGGSSGGAPAIPDSVPRVTGQRVRVEWKNLNPRRNDPSLGLINRSSPELKELYRNPGAYEHIKPVDDDAMAVIVEAFRDRGFFEHAGKGIRLEDLRMGDAHGAVTLRQGDVHHTLVFKAGLGGTGLPECYRDCKRIIIEFHRQTFWPRPSRTGRDPSRVFRVPSGRQPGR